MMPTLSFEPLMKKNNCFKNPFVVLPMVTELTNPKGRMTPPLLMHYRGLAKTEVAMVIAGPATVVPPKHRRYSLLRVDQPKYMDGLSALVKVIRSNGAIPGIQIVYVEGLGDPQAWAAGDLPQIDPNASFNMRKIFQAYCSAVHRAETVGFRYVELCAQPGGFLYSLIQRSAHETVSDLFTAIHRETDAPTMTGLRLNDDVSQPGKWAEMFVESGGTLVASAHVGLPRDVRMIDLRPSFDVSRAQKTLSSASLIGLNPHPGLKKQITDCLGY